MYYITIIPLDLHDNRKCLNSQYKLFIFTIKIVKSVIAVHAVKSSGIILSIALIRIIAAIRIRASLHGRIRMSQTVPIKIRSHRLQLQRRYRLPRQGQVQESLQMSPEVSYCNCNLSDLDLIGIAKHRNLNRISCLAFPAPKLAIRRLRECVTQFQFHRQYLLLTSL